MLKTYLSHSSKCHSRSTSSSSRCIRKETKRISLTAVFRRFRGCLRPTAAFLTATRCPLARARTSAPRTRIAEERRVGMPSVCNGHSKSSIRTKQIVLMMTLPRIKDANSSSPKRGRRIITMTMIAWCGCKAVSKSWPMLISYEITCRQSNRPSTNSRTSTTSSSKSSRISNSKRRASHRRSRLRKRAEKPN